LNPLVCELLDFQDREKHVQLIEAVHQNIGGHESVNAAAKGLKGCAQGP